MTDLDCMTVCTPAPIVQPATPQSQPCGTAGPATDREPGTGRFVRGNRAALVVGQSSAAFWAGLADAQRDIVQAVLTDAGHAAGDAPRALRLAADGVAQAALLRDAAFQRVVEAGGPMTASGRTRRAFTVWLAATDRLERQLRLVGLRRVPRAVGSITEYCENLKEAPDGSAV